MAKFDCGQALATPRDPRLHKVRWLQIRQARQPNRFHMHEDVRIRLADPIEKAVALYSIEPLYLHRFERARAIRQGLAVGAISGRNGRSCRAGQGFAEIDRNNPSRLQSAILLFDDAFDQRAFGQAAAAMVAQNRKMDQHIAVALLADQETEPASRIEPFDPPGNPEAIAVVMTAVIIIAFGIIAFGNPVPGVIAALAENCVRDKGFGKSRRTGDRRRTLSCLAHAIVISRQGPWLKQFWVVR